MAVYRIFVEKKRDFAVEAASVLSDLHQSLGLSNLQRVRIINRYDVENIDSRDFRAARSTVFSEPQVDDTYDEMPEAEGARVFAVEFLPGQFDQRADSCEQCIQFSTQKDRPTVRTAKIYVLEGMISDEEFEKIKNYLINPVECRQASLEKPQTLAADYAIPTTVETLTGFTQKTREELADFISSYGLAMDLDDIQFCQDYFKNEEKRDPTITEIRMIDTYWSDHCRHTTFLTNIDSADIEPEYVAQTYGEYLSWRKELGREHKPVTLMDLATIGAKILRKQGCLNDLDESEEINACSVRIDVDADGETIPYLLMFKNETHNHPTEIEPFGGAATCLGGAIRDPLSGRSYVYQAMRVTGAGNPLTPFEKTLKGKLPQKKIVTTAAGGYSSYGNQIGLATGHVAEVYHDGYVAKRMEIGAVVGAAPAENVVREVPSPSDIVILLGGRTGRDGCGGATGSSKSHTLESLETCGAEVQKGNAPEERKLQRLFRNPQVTRMIKRCNDFGAGGVSVAIGELADGLFINLDKVPKKYDGLDGTELAISESQERMAVVVRKEDVQRFIAQAQKENLEATVVAEVRQEPRLEMDWNGNRIVSLSREFLNSNGAPKHTSIRVSAPQLHTRGSEKTDMASRFRELAGNLNVCSQKGLVERFDSTIGANTVLMPFGGKYQLTPAQAMAAKVPVLGASTTTCSLMGWGFNPDISSGSPYHGAMLAVIESVAKIVAAGGSYHKCWLTFQEYFERTQNNPTRWGKPFAALLGALKAQLELKIASIGGKDSMSGTFEDIDVPPTLVSFAVSVAKTGNIATPELKAPGHVLGYLAPQYEENGLPCFESVRRVFDTIEALVAQKKAKAVWTIGYGGIAEGIMKMSFGNRIGVTLENSSVDLFSPTYGAFIVELEAPCQELQVLGHTCEDYAVTLPDGTRLDLTELQTVWESKLEPVFPCNIPTPKLAVQSFSYVADKHAAPAVKLAKPQVLIPVFPGTNCEYDTARRFELAGARPEIFVIRNLSSSAIEESVQEMVRLIGSSQIIALPGGFSGGDEPEGSGKFITAFFRNPAVKDAVHELLKNRDGLMCGICNGFQALVKLGLVPFGEIVEMDATCPTLTYNNIGRHQSMLVHTRVASNKSPWFMHSQVGEVHTVAISHGEGKFVASEEWIQRMASNGQIATQYVDLAGTPTMDIRFNPNGSVQAIEGITSEDGRILGKMGHSERIGEGLYQNVPGSFDQKIFQGAVDYFRG